LAKAYKKRVLGRGLSAILNEDDNNRFKEDINSNNINEIDVNDISLNPDQPRTNFNQNSLEQLASSINELGLIQPITVKEKDGKYILISGERRLRAFKKLNLDSIPAYIRKANDQSSLEMALVENIQRRDLDAIEIAISYKRLTEELNLSHDEMSKKLGKDRSTITNYIRLLKLDPIIQSGIRDKFISMGHGRAIINIASHEKQLFIYEQILKNNLSVRQTEIKVRELDKPKTVTKNIEIDKSIEDQIQKTESKIKSKINLKKNKNKFILSFIFKSKRELIQILKKLND
tara:strand:+ start:1325 stop:2191 length:867 start_codon:yes stop_codon:yes gene_type:complete